MYEKLVVITRKTRLQELVAQFNTKAQARFYIEHAGGDFADYEHEDDTYRRAQEHLTRHLDGLLKLQLIEREFLGSFLFAAADIVIALGQDGLVANAAKYVGAQPLVGVNPDPKRFDGILVGVPVAGARACVESILSDRASIRETTLAEVTLNDGARLLAFNDLFVGARTHISARYRLEYNGQAELQSSSGLIVSTGAGSTGWLSSVFNMASSVSRLAGGQPVKGLTRDWESRDLVFVVREPFVSRQSSAGIGSGILADGQELVVESRMPCGGTIFSDGVESDFLPFGAGRIARIKAACQKARLVTMPTQR